MHDKDISHVEVGIVNSEIPVSFYTINEYNCELYVSYRLPSAGFITVSKLVMPLANYTATSFISVFLDTLATLIGLATPIATAVFVTLDRNTGKLLISMDTAFVSTLIFRSTDLGGSNNSTMFTLMGFDADFVVGSVATLAPFPINLLGINKISIRSSTLATYSYDSGVQGFGNILGVIEVDAPPYGVILYKNTSMTYSLLRVRDIDLFSIQLTDEKSNLIDFNNQPWSMTLLLNVIHVGRPHPPLPSVKEKAKEVTEKPKEVTEKPTEVTEKAKEIKEKEKPKDKELELLTSP